jgi:hypothetical protein
MIRRLAVLVGLVAAFVLPAGLAAPAAACPLVTSKTATHHFSSRDLATPRAAAVRAGGTVVLDACADVPGAGHVPFEPSAVIDLAADLRGRGVEIATEPGCDTVLLLRTARGNWYFDAGNGPGRAARLILANPASGRYRIWVGTTDAFGCDTRLTMRTVRPAGGGLFQPPVRRARG